jgi:hypothetical protein
MRVRLFGIVVPGLLLCSFAANGADTKEPAPEEIIQKFAAKEAEFAKARERYTYRQTLKIQELTPSGAVQGQHEMVSDIIFSAEGKRTEKVVRAPVSTMHLMLDPGDEQDLRNVQPFVLTTDELSKYDIRYLGKQKVDEIPCYQFAVKPKKMVSGQRYFEGEIWVDDRDFQIVKTFGKGVGLLKKGADNQYPRFETYREQIDGKYWFPTYTRADDVLHFKDMDQRLRMTVKYEDYKQFKAESNITFIDEIKDGAAPAKTPEKK